MKIINIVGARPNFMKMSPLMAAYRNYPDIQPLLVHTGQHYDEQMSESFFRDLGIPRPDLNLGVRSGSHAVQTAQMMIAFEPVLIEHKPDAVLVVGDVNSTIACGMVAVKLGIKLIHVEAGLRSYDRQMPEEINRVLVDSISDVLFCTEQSGVDNLRKEGVSDDKVFLVGNLMIDTLLRYQSQAESSKILEQLKLKPRGYAVLTLHRPSNVDDPAALSRIMEAVEFIQRDLPIVFPLHPRTRKTLATPALASQIAGMKNLMITDPAAYFDFVKLLSSASVVLTDSGGIQEETTILGVPCLTLRENTERPVTVTMGTNIIAGTDPSRVIQHYKDVVSKGRGPAKIPPLWDGAAADRIVNVLRERL